MHNYTRDDIFHIVEEEDVAFIRLQFTDIFGTMKNMAVTVGQLEKALDNRCMFDVSSLEGVADEEESDMYLYPDLSTFEIFPWRPQQGKVARLICDVYKKDGTPYEGDPRYVLRKAVAEAKEMGYTMNVGPECEFFLFHTDDDGRPTTVTHEQGGYFDVGPLDLGENARRDMILTLEDMGFEIISSHHEIAPAQHEIDFHYDEAMITADNLMTFKMVVKTIAKRHGLHATFMPKPKSETYGSGMHINLSLYKNDGTNALYNAEDENGLSQEGYYFIGGLMKHMKAITCITNPTINSYKRFVPGYEAPVYMGWSAKTRGRQCPAGADHVGGQHRFRPEAQSLCRFQQFLSGKRLPQCDKIGIAGIPHGICQILQSVPLRVVAAEPLGANGNRPVAVPLKRRFRTVFIGTGCRHQLENRPHRIGVQGTLDHGAVRILHGFSQCIGRVAGKAGKPQKRQTPERRQEKGTGSCRKAYR